MTASEPAEQAASQTGSLSPQGQQSQQAAEQTRRFIQVPEDDPVLKEYGGRWGEVGKAAKQYRQAEQTGVFASHAKAVEMAQKYGYETVGEYLDAVDAYIAKNAQTSGQSGDQAQQNGSAEDKPLTRQELAALLDERDSKAEAKRSQSEQQRAQQQARYAETQSMAAALKELGIEPSETDEDAQDDFEDSMLRLDRQIAKARRAAFQEHPSLPKAVNDKRMSEFMNRPATASEIKDAAQRLQAKLTDSQNRAVGNFAQKQRKQMPFNSTQGTGPGGRQQAKSIKDMTPEEHEAYVTQDMKA